MGRIGWFSVGQSGSRSRSPETRFFGRLSVASGLTVIPKLAILSVVVFKLLRRSYGVALKVTTSAIPSTSAYEANRKAP
jgi:hypothetical protein